MMMKKAVLPIAFASIGAVTYALYKYITTRRAGIFKGECHENILSLMKNTPLIYIKSLSEITGCNVYAKCEYFLPYTSKDRMIKNIILNAHNGGILHKDSMIYEGSSGSTAYSVAAIARFLGYKCTIVIPDDCSEEKVQLIQTTGCTLIKTKQCPFSNFKDNYIRLAKKKAFKDPNGFYVDQFFNETNYQTHYNETAPEIWKEMQGKIDAFVCSAGTGGTIGGISRYLKHMNPKIKVFLGDLAGSGLYSYVKHGVMFTKEESEGMRKKYRNYSIVEGIGINILTENFMKAMIDDAYKVTDEDATTMAKMLYEKDGIFIGGSSAVNCCALVQACHSLPKGSNVLTIFFDSGMKYMSKMFSLPHPNPHPQPE